MKLGVMGTGNMAAQMVKAAETIDGLEVAAILSRDEGRAKAFCAVHVPAAQPLKDMAHLLSASDAIYIATPPDQHFPNIIAALEAGKPTLCEKPLTLTPKETAAAIEMAQEKSVPLMEALWTVTLPAYGALKTQLAQTDIATCRMRFDFSYPLAAADDAHFFDLERGGVLLDRAIYGYGAALFLFGAIKQQTVFVDKDSNGLDRAATLQLQHDNGAQSLVTLSFDHLGANALDVATPQGTAQLGPSSLSAENLRWSAYTAAPVTHAVPAKSNFVQKLKSQPVLRRLKAGVSAGKTQFHSFGASPYQPVLEEFVRVVRSKAPESLFVPLSMSQKIADLVAEARNPNKV